MRTVTLTPSQALYHPNSAVRNNYRVKFNEHGPVSADIVCDYDNELTLVKIRNEGSVNAETTTTDID